MHLLPIPLYGPHLLREHAGRSTALLPAKDHSQLQFIYGITRGYSERFEIEHLDQLKKNTIYFFAWTGYLDRGVILIIIGFFLIKASLEENTQQVVNTDKAFDFMGDDIGHFDFLLVAAFTICYGLFILKYEED